MKHFCTAGDIFAQMPPPARSHGPLQAKAARKSRSVDEAREVVSSVFCDHRLVPDSKMSRLGFELRHAPFGKGSSLNLLTYGADVQVVPGEMQEVFNVQLQIWGSSQLTLGNNARVIETGSAGVLSPGQFVSMDWQTGSQMLIYSVRRQMVEKALREIFGMDIGSPLCFNPEFHLSRSNGQSFLRMLTMLREDLESSTDPMGCEQSAEHFEQSLIYALLFSHDHNYSTALRKGLSKAAPVHVSKAERFMRENLAETITIEQLVDVSDVSSRTLFAAFSRFRGQSPMQYLRNLRLDEARRILQSGQSTSVTEAALDVGLSQLGRFSVEYRKRFGESPSQTLRTHH